MNIINNILSQIFFSIKKRLAFLFLLATLHACIEDDVDVDVDVDVYTICQFEKQNRLSS